MSKHSVFHSKEDMKFEIFKYDLKNKLFVCNPSSNKRRFEVECTHRCCKFIFRTRRWKKKFLIWHVIEFVSSCTFLHNLDRVERWQTTYKVISHMFANRLSKTKFSADYIVSEIRVRYVVNLLYSMTWRAFQYVIDLAYRTHKESWQLESYLKIFKETNLGKVIYMQTSKDDHFLYSFFSLPQRIDQFQKYICLVIFMVRF